MSSRTTLGSNGDLNTYRGVDLVGFQPDVALFVDDPRLGGLEVTGGGYVRQPVIFAAPSSQSMVNLNLITFPAPTTDWDLIGFVVLMNGNVPWDVTQLEETEANRTVLAGSTPITFAPGSILVRVA